jgi:hypothetical protein
MRCARVAELTECHYMLFARGAELYQRQHSDWARQTHPMPQWYPGFGTCPGPLTSGADERVVTLPACIRW